jgi:histidinol-phosphate aminotransferase
MNIWPDWLPIRNELKGLSPYGAPQISDVISLNTNENPFSLPKEVVTAILTKLGFVLENLNRYPDRDATTLREKLSSYINSQAHTNFEIQNIWAANGSNEILQTLVIAFGQRGVLGFTPSYSMHSLISKVCGARWIEGKRNSNFSIELNAAKAQIMEEKPGITFITTPNNPTGNSISLKDIEELATLTKQENGLLIIDEAYAEFSSHETSLKLIDKHQNLIVVRTMSKAFALAGARVGYMVCDRIITEVALLARLPYHLSSQTQAIAEVALDHHDLLQKEINLLVSERNRVSEKLVEMGLNVIKSDANFLLFTGFSVSAAELWNYLLQEKVLVRDVGIPNFLRVTIGTPKENDKFLSAIAAHRS